MKEIQLAREIELWPPDRLVPYAKNSRTHSEEQIEKIAKSMQRFGFTNPILVDSKDGIIAGHGRLMAANKIGLAEIPVIVLDHLTDEERRAYIIADNRLAEDAGWDRDILADELADLRDEDFDLSVIGFSEDELSELLTDDVEEAGMPDLAAGERQTMQQMTFTLAGDQVEVIKEALEVAKGMGEFVDTGNENSNGNALARMAEMFLMANRPEVEDEE